MSYTWPALVPPLPLPVLFNAIEFMIGVLTFECKLQSSRVCHALLRAQTVRFLYSFSMAPLQPAGAHPGLIFYDVSFDRYT